MESQDQIGLFGQRLYEPVTGRQREMTFETDLDGCAPVDDGWITPEGRVRTEAIPEVPRRKRK